MIEGTVLTLSDNIHKATVQKIISNQSMVIECSDKQLSFVRLIENDDIYRGIPFASWMNIFYRK
jgi:hypothetical protein